MPDVSPSIQLGSGEPNRQFALVDLVARAKPEKKNLKFSASVDEGGA
jgi:hypothetical protein